MSFLALRDLMRALSAHRDGASINAAAKASGINYRTAQRIVEAAAAPAAESCGGQLTAPSPEWSGGASPVVDHRPGGCVLRR